MPFLAAAIPAIVGGAAAAGGGAIVNGIIGGGGKGTNFNAFNGVTAGDVTGSMNNTQGALQQQQALLTALQGQNGIGNQSNVYGQLQGVANGQGPNPAQTMLANSTGANVANQAALMAGQRGSSANAGLIARQASQQGGALQQQAAGQGAALQAQQSLGALGQMGALSTQQVAQQQAAQGAVTQGNLQEQQLRESALSGQNSTNAGIQGQIAQGQIGAAGGIANGLGGALGLIAQNAMGGTGSNSNYAPGSSSPGPWAPKFAEGGGVEPKSRLARHLKGMPALARGGKVPALVSPGEIYLSPAQAREVAHNHVSPLKVGSRIPGQAKVSGDSERNDTVKKTLDVGGVVVPRTKAGDSAKAQKFVQAVVSKGSKRR